MIILVFGCLQGAVARQEAGKVIAIPIRLQLVQQMPEVFARVDVIKTAAIDDRVHKSVVRCGTLADGVARIAQVHLELAHGLSSG